MKLNVIFLLLVAFIFPNLSTGKQCSQLFANNNANLLDVDFSSSIDITAKAVVIYSSLFKELPRDNSFKAALNHKFLPSYGQISKRVRNFEVNFRTVREELIVPLADLIGRAHEAKSGLEKNEAYLDLAASWPEFLLKLNKAIQTLRLGASYNSTDSNFELKSTNLEKNKSLAIHQILTEIWNVSANFKLDASFINQLAESLDEGSRGIRNDILDELGINYLRVVVKARQAQLNSTPPSYSPFGTLGKDIN